MEENTSKLLIAAILFLGFSMFYTHLRATTIEFDGHKFILTGMATQTFEGQVLSLPVYREVK